MSDIDDLIRERQAIQQRRPPRWAIVVVVAVVAAGVAIAAYVGA